MILRGGGVPPRRLLLFTSLPSREPSPQGAVQTPAARGREPPCPVRAHQTTTGGASPAQRCPRSQKGLLTSSGHFRDTTECQARQTSQLRGPCSSHTLRGAVGAAGETGNFPPGAGVGPQAPQFKRTSADLAPMFLAKKVRPRKRDTPSMNCACTFSRNPCQSWRFKTDSKESGWGWGGCCPLPRRATHRAVLG